MARLHGTVVETGQAVQIDAPRKRKRKRGWRDSVAMIDLTAMNRLELSGGEYRVLLAIMSHVPEKGGADAKCTLQEIASEIGMALSSVSRSAKMLRERNVLLKRDRRQGRWRVSSWLMYNGDFDSWNAEVEKDPEPVWVRDVDLTTGEIQ
jgi:DNA-binding transcriptional ArsR family regulator